MPTKPPPSEVLAALVTQRYPVPTEAWGDFWDRLGAKALHPGEALAVLSSLTTRMPDGVSVSNCLASLRERNPRLVYCSISGFGASDRAGYDFVVQAESGLMSITGEPGGEPLKVGVAVVDVLAGLNAAVGILAALERRRRTGEGARVETSLLASALSALVNQAQGALATGVSPPRLGNAHPSIVPYETFHARDATLAIAAPNDDLFRRLCRIGRAHV